MRKKYPSSKGKIIIPAGRRPWAHELHVAGILASAGYIVEFLPESNKKTADILLNGIEYEIKSPLTNKLDKLERNVKRALKQSNNIIFDSSRVKNGHDITLQRFLTKKLYTQKQIHHLILINKRGKVIDIKNLV